MLFWGILIQLGVISLWGRLSDKEYNRLLVGIILMLLWETVENVSNNIVLVYEEELNVSGNKLILDVVYLLLVLIMLSTQSEVSGWSERYIKYEVGKEYSLLVIFLVISGLLLYKSVDLLLFFLLVEWNSYAMYVIAAMNKWSLKSTSSSLKYFLLGSLSSTLILFGIGWLYINYGTTNLWELKILREELGIGWSEWPVVLIILGIFFKLGVAPIHNWIIEVYDNTSTDVTIWLSVYSKYGIGLLVIYVLISLITDVLSNIVIMLGVLSLVVGILLGLVQTRVKRWIVSSIITHVGYILLFLIWLPDSNVETGYMYYVIQYSVTNLLLWLGLLYLGYKRLNKIGVISVSPIQNISQLNNLWSENKILSVVLVVGLLSLIGIPPLVGFWGKQQLIIVLSERGMWWLIWIVIVASVVSSVYYLKLIHIIYLNNDIKSSNNSEIGGLVSKERGVIVWDSKSPINILSEIDLKVWEYNEIVKKLNKESKSLYERENNIYIEIREEKINMLTGVLSVLSLCLVLNYQNIWIYIDLLSYINS